MKKGIIWITLSFLIVVSMVLASCGSTKTTSTTTTTTSDVVTTSSTTSPTSTTSSAVITTAATTTSTVNWWDSLGTPQYGGTLTLRLSNDITQWDPYLNGAIVGSAYGEYLFGDIWTINPSVFAYSIDFRPTDYVGGLLASSWEFTNPNTLVVHLKHEVYWQNIPPVNGRQFIASDVVYNYDRLYGLGGGFTTPSPNYAGSPIKQSLTSLTAPDNFTVVFTWNVINPEYILETIEALANNNEIAAPEAVNQWGNLNDWHNQIGTGPFILKDYVTGSSVTFIKNPNYWGHDDRYPQNQLPYISSMKVLIIPTLATALAAVRTGKIDYIDQVGSIDAQNMGKTSPEVLQSSEPSSTCLSVDPRNDVKPFNGSFSK